MTSSNRSAIVIDAGVGYKLCTPNAIAVTLRAEIAAQAVVGVVFYAPSLWQFEFTSILTKAVHFRHLSEGVARQVLELGRDLRVQFVAPDYELVTLAFDWTLRLKRAAAYDSFYLALAQRLRCELWRVDQRLANAAAMSWVRYVGDVR